MRSPSERVYPSRVLESWLRQLENPDDPQLRGLSLFLRLIPLQLATEYVCAALASWASLDATRFVEGAAPRAYGFDVPLQAFLGVLATLAVLLVPLQLHPRTARVGRWAALALAVSLCVATFPRCGNHLYLVVIVLTLCVQLEFSGPDARDLLARSLRWILVVVFFYSGLQKLAHGFYLDGQMLAFLGNRTGFAELVSMLVPADEATRIAGLSRVAGGGPFSSTAPLLVAASNLTYVGEMFLPLLLLLPKTRRFAIPATFALILAIELFAREVFFGLWFTGLLLLYARPPTYRRAFVVVVALDVAMLLVRVGALPEVHFK